MIKTFFDTMEWKRLEVYFIKCQILDICEKMGKLVTTVTSSTDTKVFYDTCIHFTIEALLRHRKIEKYISEKESEEIKKYIGKYSHMCAMADFE